MVHRRFAGSLSSRAVAIPSPVVIRAPCQGIQLNATPPLDAATMVRRSIRTAVTLFEGNFHFRTI